VAGDILIIFMADETSDNRLRM